MTKSGFDIDELERLSISKDVVLIDNSEMSAILTEIRELRAENARLRVVLGAMLEYATFSERWQDEHPEYLAMARAALREARRIDRGRVVVPTEPTAAMKMAGAAAITEDHMAKMANYDAAIDCWAAMLNECMKDTNA